MPEDVAGLHGRIRLARADGPVQWHLAALRLLPPPFLSPARASGWTHNVTFFRPTSTSVTVVKQGMDGASCREHLGDVVEMENEMRNGIFLAKLAKQFGPNAFHASSFT